MARIKGDREPVLCGVCRRRAYGFGVAPAQSRPVMWLCDDPRCWALGRGVYDMPTGDLDRFERAARDAAGERAGAYLDSLGKTDLATLTAEEWSIFLHQIIVGFEDELRRIFSKSLAPF
ncbi:DUF6511 domain-containing protein [Methylobacterium oryzisoli]|uniref:DUF6511 domain-containing protein n=1 Tax=Methylobacterium oryzisoli TaxID=3385502 RepID=UPI0038913AAD